MIYDHDDNMIKLQYYKTMISANLALARGVNYDCKVHCKLESNLQS
jgi:hypothetical protein